MDEERLIPNNKYVDRNTTKNINIDFPVAVQIDGFSLDNRCLDEKLCLNRCIIL